jgi:hypothetical protein
MLHPRKLSIGIGYNEEPFQVAQKSVSPLSYGEIDRGFDRKADSLANPQASGMPGGMHKSTIDEVLESPGLAERMRNSELRQLPTDGKRAYFSWDLLGFLWDALLGSDTLHKMVTNYLGPDARIDDLYVKTVLDGYDSTSEGWHDDNVGYRIKVFMVFDTEGHPSGTVVVPTDRPNIYQVRLADELARMVKKPKMDSRPNQQLVSYNAGDCLTFDTNIPHRGDYSAGQGIRYCVIAEFIDRNKADALRGRAPCGPGQGRYRIKIPADLGIDLALCPLIDQKLVNKNETGITYGY